MKIIANLHIDQLQKFMKKKILIIPSWYPTPENKMIGVFFREQALIFHDDFDFFVVSISPFNVGFFKFLYYYFKHEFFYFDIQTPPSGIGIKFLQLKFPGWVSFFVPFVKFLDKINYKFMCRFAFLSLSNVLGRLGWKPDIIHAQSTVDGGIFANYLSEKINIPFIISEHQVFLLQNYTVFKRQLIHNAMKCADKLIVISEHQKRQILMNRIECDPLLLGNMVDNSLFAIKKTESAVFNILVVTYSHYIKDNDTFFKAIKLLVSDQIRNFKVLIVGGDVNNTGLIDKENPLYKQAESYGITEYVEILNQVDREKMPEIFNNCDVFISTSIAETFGLACCEAMMCGIPVIVTANGGIDEMICKKNGIKVPIRDYNAVAKAIIQIKNKEISFNPEEVRSSVIGKFGKDAFRNKLMEIYKSV